MPEIIDWMARNGLHEVPETHEARGGWTWRFDPQFWGHFERGDLARPVRPRVADGRDLWREVGPVPDGRVDELVRDAGRLPVRHPDLRGAPSRDGR